MLFQSLHTGTDDIVEYKIDDAGDYSVATIRVTPVGDYDERVAIECDYDELVELRDLIDEMIRKVDARNKQLAKKPNAGNIPVLVQLHEEKHEGA